MIFCPMSGVLGLGKLTELQQAQTGSNIAKRIVGYPSFAPTSQSTELPTFSEHPTQARWMARNGAR
jgi:hypothetical protein